MGVCVWREVECPCVGCYERMPRHDVKQHMEHSVWEHMNKAHFVVGVHTYAIKDLEIRNKKLVCDMYEVKMNSS